MTNTCDALRSSSCLGLFRRRDWIVCGAILLAAALGLAGCSGHYHEPRGSALEEDASAATTLMAAHERLPIQFEPNYGQADPRVRFLSRGPDYALFLAQTEAVIALSSDEAISSLRVSYFGANPKARTASAKPLPGKVNYYLGKDPAGWLPDIPTFREVSYESIYPGIDLVYHGRGGELEYDFVVAPGADPSAIRLAFIGADDISLDDSGDLHLTVGGREVLQRAPIIYQEANGIRQHVAGAYAQLSDDQIGFQLGAYDETRPLVIDPILGLSYSSYFGDGTIAHDITLGPNGNIYLVGETFLTSFPTTQNAHQPACGPSPTLTDSGCRDAFVTKLSPDGDAIVYSTFLGGGENTIVDNPGHDAAYGVAVGEADDAYVTGESSSLSFPTTAGAFQIFCKALPRPVGGLAGGDCLPDVFVAKFNTSGSLVYSTLVGGANVDIGNAIGVNLNGNAYVTGLTYSKNDDVTMSFDESFPVSGSAFFPECRGGQSLPPYEQDCHDAFYFKLSVDGSFLVDSSFLGGSGDDEGRGIVVDGTGRAWVTGSTNSTDFLTTVATNPWRDSCPVPCADGFVTFWNVSESNPDCVPVAGDDCHQSPGSAAGGYSTYLGGSDIGGEDIAIDASRNVYVTGSGQTIVTTAGAYDTTHDLGADAFVVKLDAAGSNLLLGTYLGGRGHDRAMGIAVGAQSNIYVTGHTFGRFDSQTGKLENDFPTRDPLPGQEACHREALGNCTFDGFVSKLLPDGSDLDYSTYLGGNDIDRPRAIHYSGTNRVFVTGDTSSSNYPTTSGAIQTTCQPSCALVSIISELSDADQDGHAPISEGGDDCDDNNPAIWDCNTPVSEDPVTFEDPSGVEVEFPNITAGGDTTVGVEECQSAPEGIFLTFSPLCVTVNTDAEWDGLVEVCIPYDDTGVPNEMSMVMVRCDNAGTNCENITSSRDTDANIICGLTDEFSLFAVGPPTDGDGDFVPDLDDNCPLVINFFQENADGDAYGDACECGDASADGFVNSIDARLIQRCAVGQISCEALCDVTGEGTCNSIDARLIQRLAVGQLSKTDLLCDERP